jgi:hypothetical protein
MANPNNNPNTQFTTASSYWHRHRIAKSIVALTSFFGLVGCSTPESESTPTPTTVAPSKGTPRSCEQKADQPKKSTDTYPIHLRNDDELAVALGEHGKEKQDAFWTKEVIEGVNYLSWTLRNEPIASFEVDAIVWYNGNNRTREDAHKTADQLEQLASERFSIPRLAGPERIEFDAHPEDGLHDSARVFARAVRPEHPARPTTAPGSCDL